MKDENKAKVEYCNMNSVFGEAWNISGLILMTLFFFFVNILNAQTTETLSSGSFIINMGITPQTRNNALKPYGLIYDLLKNYYIPVKWVINSSKAKDGIDFTYNNVNYKGGTFIIPAEYRNAAVNARITYWTTTFGIQGVTTTSNITVPVYTTLWTFPRWTLDDQNGAIAEKYLINAGIPTNAYDWRAPSTLDGCNDLFVMPHAEPTWAEHANLLLWNKNMKGNIWAGCHAVSNLENLYNPSDLTQKMNFLSNPPLLIDKQHSDPSPPFNYEYPSHPFMQFIGTFDNAVMAGAEQVYLPPLGGSWRNSVKVGVWDATQVDVPKKSPGKAAILAFGKAFDDVNQGSIMYIAGHNLADKNGTEAEQVAAQRAFLNFSFATANERAVIPIITISNTIDDTIYAGTSTTFTLTFPQGVLASDYSIEWLSSVGGTFSNPKNAVTTYTPPATSTTSSTLITAQIKDDCGRVYCNTKYVTILCDIKITPSTINCVSGSNGVVNLNVTGMTAKTPYTYSWKNGNSVGSGSGSSISGLSVGTYSITLTSGSGCQATETATVYPQPNTPSVVGNLVNNCPTNTVNLNDLLKSMPPSVVGGIFEWHVSNDPTSALVNNPTSVGTGNYYLFEKASNGCYSQGATVQVILNDCCPAIYFPMTIKRRKYVQPNS